MVGRPRKYADRDARLTARRQRYSQRRQANTIAQAELIPHEATWQPLQQITHFQHTSLLPLEANTSETTPLTFTVPDTFTALRAEIDHERFVASDGNHIDLDTTAGEWIVSPGEDLEESILPQAENTPAPGPEELEAVQSTGPRVISPRVQQLARGIAQQLLQHHGCPANGHVRAEPSVASGQHMIGLREATQQTVVPSVLEKPTFQQHPAPWADEFAPVVRRQLLCGLGPNETASPDSPRPPTVDPGLANAAVPQTLPISFDIDSSGGWATSLAVARQGLHWLATRPATSTLTSSLHLDPLLVEWTDTNTQRLYHRHVPIHQVPHLPLGRLRGFEAMEIFIIFPRLYQPSRKAFVLTNEEYTEWMDHLMLPALVQTLPQETISRLPGSGEEAIRRGTAAAAEGATASTHQLPRVQLLTHFIGPTALGAIWAAIQDRLAPRAHTANEYGQARLLLTSKNLKSETRRGTWSQMVQGWGNIWCGAVDDRFITGSFFDVAKEVSLPNQILGQEATGYPHALELTWRRCCLSQFEEWLVQTEITLQDQPELATIPSPSPTEPVPPTQSPTPSPSPTEPVPPTQSPTPSPSPTEPIPPTQSPTQSPTPSLSPTESTTPSTKPVQSQFWPWALLRDVGSLTVETKRQSTLRQAGLLYAQLYNTSKEIFAVGKQYPFGNEALDTLALPAALVQVLQHAGGGRAHSRATVLRGYLHTKARCHLALQGAQDRSYGTREEYRVTATLLSALDGEMEARGGNGVLHVPPRDVAPPPFYCHTTDDALQWLRWNLNRLCLAVELVYSIRPARQLHWEHSRVAMAFLRALHYGLGGQGASPSHCRELWISERTQPPGEGEETGTIIEGLGWGETMQRYGFAWFLDKFDWGPMLFREPHRTRLAIRLPSLLGSYIPRYGEVRQLLDDWVFLHDVFRQLEACRGHRPRARKILVLLADLCLTAFRREVFQRLSTVERLRGPRAAAALEGRQPLTMETLRDVLPGGRLADHTYPLGARGIQIRHIDTMFAFLWGWDGDGMQGELVQRHHWGSKPYRELFRRSFDAIAATHSYETAQEWRGLVHATFVRTHWVLPNPSQRDFWPRGRNGRLPLWCSTHPSLVQYVCREMTGQVDHEPVVFRWTPTDLPTLPRTGWERSTEAFGTTLPVGCRVEVILPALPTDNIEDWVCEDTSATTADVGPLIPPLDEEGDIARWIWARHPPRYALRKLTQQPRWSPENLIRQPWLVTSYSDDIFTRVRAVDQARCEAVGLQRFPRLKQVDAEELDELADPNSIRREEQRAIEQSARHRELAMRAKTALRKVWKYDTQMTIIKKGKVVKGTKVFGRQEYARVTAKRALAREEFSRPIEEILAELDPERFPMERFVASRRERMARTEGEMGEGVEKKR